MTRFFLFWGCVLVSATGCSAGDGPLAVEAPAVEQADDAQGEPIEIAKRLLEQYRQAYTVRSFEALSALYADGLDVTIVWQGKRHSGASAARAVLQQTLARAKSAYLYLDNIQAQRTSATTLLVQVDLRRELSDGVTTVAEKGVLTLVVRQQAGLDTTPGPDVGTGHEPASVATSQAAWRIVAEHFSYGR